MVESESLKQYLGQLGQPGATLKISNYKKRIACSYQLGTTFKVLELGQKTGLFLVIVILYYLYCC